jgi:serine/threonine-protein kinase
VRNACLGLTGAALQACLGTPQQVPPVRHEPPPEACPAGAVETMTDILGLRLREIRSVQFSDVRGRPIRVQEDTPVYMPGHWMAGADRNGRGGWKIALPDDTRISGRLYFGATRVYGRFTEALTPSGLTYRVCLELLDTRGNVGLEYGPGGEPGKPLVFSVAQLRVVDHFK